MTNIIIIALFLTFIFIFLKFFVLYLLMKFFDKSINIFSIIKLFLVYELLVIILFSLKPHGLNSLLSGYLKISIVFILSFTIFNFLTHYYSLFNFKKSIIIFLLMFFLLTPLLYFCKTQIEKRISNYQYNKMDKTQLYNQLFIEISHPPILSKINMALNSSILEGGFLFDLSVLNTLKD
jgi:hypothetical protein